jgi:hypothetical protein
MRAGGYGMLLAAGTVDELIYNETGNEVILIKYLDKFAQGPSSSALPYSCPAAKNGTSNTGAPPQLYAAQLTPLHRRLEECRLPVLDVLPAC